MDCWERAWHTNTHTHLHTHTNTGPLSQTIDISDKWASSKMCMNRITEKQLDHWFVLSNCAEWQSLQGGNFGWNLASGHQHSTLYKRIFLQRVTVHSSIVETEDCWQIIFMKYKQIGLLTGKPHRIRRGWIYTRQIGLISTGPVPDRCNLSDITLPVETEANCECRHVSQTSSALKVVSLEALRALCFLLFIFLVLWLSSPLSDVCVFVQWMIDRIG